MTRHRELGHAGFALLELLTVLAIIAILASIALPQYARYLDKAHAAGCQSNRHNIELEELARLAGSRDWDQRPGGIVHGLEPGQGSGGSGLFDDMMALVSTLLPWQAATGWAANIVQTMLPPIDPAWKCPSGGTYVWLVTDPDSFAYPKVGCSLHFATIPAPVVEEKSGLEMIDGLVAAFKLDDGSGDTVTFGDQSGQIYGASWVDGKSGSALSFDGKNDYVQADVADWSGPFTVMSWVKALPTGQNQYDSVFSSGSNGPNKDNFQIDTDGKGNYRFLGGGGQAKINIGEITSDWQLIAVTFDGANVSTYNNGVLAGTGTWNGSGTFTDYVMGRNRNRGNKFGGNIDELGIFSRSVSAEEIQAYYEKTK